MNRALTVVVVCLGLALLGLHRFAAVRVADEGSRLAHIDAVRAAAIRVDTLALSVRFASLASYDTLVDAVADLRRHVREVGTPEGAGSATALTALRALVDERTVQIEDLKARRSTLHNSEFALLGLLKDGGGDTVDPGLRAALLAFLLSRTAQTEDQLDAERARVRAMDDPAADLVARHAGVVLEGRRLLEDSTARFLRAPVAEAATRLAVAVNEDDAGELRRLRLAELGLLLVLLATALVTLWRR